MSSPRSARLVLSIGALAVAVAGCGRPGPLDPAAPPKARARAAHVHQVRSTSGPHPAAVHFQTYALHALLVPLLDDDAPPRWADPLLSFACEAVDVQVDDAPLDTGAPVTGGVFRVRWHMQRCTPFDSTMELTGNVELRVEPIDGGYRAVVQPIALRVTSRWDGHAILTEPFTARMRIGS